MKRVLVLMASYNGEKYIDQQIESLFAQEGVEVALLVRDDGSSDTTCEHLEKWAQKSDTRWYSGEHLNVQFGFYELMVKALESDADYFALCDQDDVWHPDKLRIAVEQLETVPPEQPGLYYCGQRLVDAQLQPIADHCLNPNRTVRTRFVCSDMAGCTGVMNRALLQAVADYRPGYMRMHDLWLVKVCVGLGGQLLVDPRPHMDYRQHGNNVVGLSGGLRAQLASARRLIFEHSISRQMQELESGYGDRIVPEYRQVMEHIFASKRSLRSKRVLMSKKYVDFHNRGANMAFAIKVLLGKV